MDDVLEVLDRLDHLGRSRERVEVDEIRDCLGRNASAQALLILGLLALSPVGDIPGAPTILSVLIVTLGLRMLLGRHRLWMPRAIARRSFRAERLRDTVRIFRPVMGALGRVIRPRLTFLTVGPAARVIAGICVLLALTLPPLEVVPFGATVPSSAIAGLATALVARDGLLTLVVAALTLGAAHAGLDLLGGYGQSWWMGRQAAVCSSVS